MSTTSFRNEFTYTRDFGRGCWVIRRHGRIYGEIERNSANPAHSERYVRRTVAMLNGDI